MHNFSIPQKVEVTTVWLCHAHHARPELASAVASSQSPGRVPWLFPPPFAWCLATKYMHAFLYIKQGDNAVTSQSLIVPYLLE